MTAAVYDDLVRPLPVWSLKRWYYGANRLALSTIGRLSDGIRIGFAHGFDSGVMLDYVYENKANGLTPIGKLIDRIYLNAPGWRGIRNRRALVSKTIAALLREAASGPRPARLTDLACGGGRYVLDAVKAAGVDARVELRDYADANVEKARENAIRAGVIATCRQADAFADNEHQSLSEADIVVVSGLHEIIPDDRRIERHFRQLAQAMKPGAKLVVTVQPYHPQLEFIARVLRSHTGKPWAMRLRTLDITRRWAVDAGFRVESVTMEPSHIFGVMVATRT